MNDFVSKVCQNIRSSKRWFGDLARRRTLSRVPLCLVLHWALASFPAMAAKAPQQADLQAVDARIAATRHWITEARSTEATTTKALREAETSLDEAHQALVRLSAEGDALAAQHAALETHIAALTASRKELADRAAVHLRVLQRLKPDDTVRLLLTMEDPGATPRMLTYYGYLQRARQRALAALNANEVELQSARAALAQRRSDLAAKRVAAQAEAGRIEALRADRRGALAALQSDITVRDSELHRLRSERAELQSLLERLAKAPPTSNAPLPPGTLFGQAKGRLPWPVSGAIASNYGTPKEGTSLKWEGLLISAPEGAEVVAVHPGQVAFTGWMRGLGTILILDHGNGFMSLYAHLNSVSHQPGDKVAARATLGQVGTSGGRASPALYFEIRQRGAPVNPSDWLGKR